MRRVFGLRGSTPGLVCGRVPASLPQDTNNSLTKYTFNGGEGENIMYLETRKIIGSGSGHTQTVDVIITWECEGV